MLDAAYAGQALDQAGQYAALEAFVARAAARGGRVLLPVPSQGRGCDMLLYLAKRFPHLPVWAEDVLVRSCEALLRQSTWIRGDLEGRSALAQVKRVCTPADRAQACACAPCLCFTTDGMLTTAESRFYLEAFGSDPASCAVITGHAAQGTPAANLLTPGWRVENSITKMSCRFAGGWVPARYCFFTRRPHAVPVCMRLSRIWATAEHLLSERAACVNRLVGAHRHGAASQAASSLRLVPSKRRTRSAKW